MSCDIIFIMDQNSLLVIIIVCIFGGVFLFVAMSPSSNLKNNYVGSDGRFINGSTDGAGFSNNVNISSCSLFGDAVPSDVFLGKTFYSDDTDTRLTGTFSLDGNVISSKMLSGYSGYGSSTSLIYGSMPIRVLSNLTPSFSSGYYDANDLNVIDTDLTGANISSGVTIFGIVGSASGGAELHSGQTTVYDSDGDDATNDGTAKSYTDNVDGTVTDNQTGLIWQKNHKDECSTLTWGGAIDYCESSTTGSYSDWRVPSNVELITLAD